MFSFHVYQRPYSPKGEECARLISEAGHAYEVHLVRTHENTQALSKLAGRRVALPHVFESASDSAEKHRIGGISALRVWLKEYGMEQTENPGPAVQACYTWTREGIEIPYYEMAHRHVMAAFRKATQGSQLTLNMVAPDRMRLTTANVWQMVLSNLRAEAWICESDSLPFYISSAATAKFRLNSCGILMDSSTEQVYNLLWLLDRWKQPHVLVYDPSIDHYAKLGDECYKATTGQVLLP